MWLTVLVVAAWLVLAVVLGRRSQRTPFAAMESVERYRRAHAAIEAAVARSDGTRARRPDPVRTAPRPPDPVRPAARARTFAGTLSLLRRPHGRRRPAAVAAVALAAALVLAATVAARRTGGPAERASARRPAGEAATAPAATAGPAAPTVPASRPTPPAPPGVLDAGRELVIAYGRPSYRVTLIASSACWFAVTEPRPHPESAGRTLVPGEQVTLEVAGALAVRLGNPGGVQIVVEDRAVELPVESGTPRTLRFVGGRT